MNKTIKLLSHTQLDTALSAIRIAAAEETLHEVVIREHKENRSAAQHRLWWQWMTEIGNEYGEMKEEVHERYKEKFLCHIFERDDEGYAQMMAAAREVWKAELKAEAKDIHRQIVKLTSTTKCTVEQMTELLNMVEMDCATNGIQLTRPEDLYHRSLGVE